MRPVPAPAGAGIERVVETCLYVEDIETASAWYERVLGLEAFASDPPRHAFLEAGDSLLLLFDPDETRSEEPDDQAPAHGAKGAQHVAFGVEDLDPWREHLAQEGVEITREASWGEGRSLYFEDPAGNVLELVTRGTWPGW